MVCFQQGNNQTTPTGPKWQNEKSMTNLFFFKKKLFLVNSYAPGTGSNISEWKVNKTDFTNACKNTS
jgi:hypothetical protein